MLPLLGPIAGRDVVRAAVVALVVGTVLVLANHGDHLLQEPVCRYFWCKVAVSYVTPLSVSIVSSALVRRGLRQPPERPRP
jgi:hypothetical protein